MYHLPVISPVSNENATVCTNCQGECCKRAPGVYTPEQELMKSVLKPIVEFRFKEMRSYKKYLKIKGLVLRDINISFNDGTYMRVYFIAPARNSSTNWCSNLTDKGCKLSFEQRPTECQELLPTKDEIGYCQTNIEFYHKFGFSKWVYVMWKDYQETFHFLDELDYNAKEVYDKFMFDLSFLNQ